MNKYEQLIEFIINDESDKARELFHNIVVEKSRDIYESLIDETDLAEVGGNEVEGLAKDVQVDEQGLSEEEESEEEFGHEESDEEDASDFDYNNDGETDEHEEDHANVEDRVVDLEAALDELKAEFDALMAGEEQEPEHADMFGGEEEVGAEEAPEEFYEAEEADDEEDDEEELEESLIREYVELAGVQPYKGDKAEGKFVGKDGSVAVNKQSTVAGKNDMGGSSANIVKGGTKTNQDGTTPTKANAYTTKNQGELIGKVQNTAGGSKSLSSATKPKAGDGQTTDGKVAVATNSPVAK